VQLRALVEHETRWRLCEYFSLLAEEKGKRHKISAGRILKEMVAQNVDSLYFQCVLKLKPLVGENVMGGILQQDSNRRRKRKTISVKKRVTADFSVVVDESLSSHKASFKKPEGKESAEEAVEKNNDDDDVFDFRV